MTVSHITQNRWELAHRSSDGIEVHLLWNQADETLTVTVSEDAGDWFELSVGSHEALEVFNHPYAYAAFRGIPATADLAA